jgi:peptide/nickel transport system substrate-binding protein
MQYTFPMLVGSAPFDDVNVRKALKWGVNRQEMVDKVLLGHGAVGNDHPIGPANQYVAKDLPQTEYDADKAKFYLKKAGLTSLNVDLSAADAAFGGALDAAQYQYCPGGKRWLLVKCLAEKTLVCLLLVRKGNRRLDVCNGI